MLTHFSNLKELISQNRNKTQTKPYVINFIPKHKTTEVYNLRIIKRSSSSVLSFFAINDSILATQRLWIFYCNGFI